MVAMVIELALALPDAVITGPPPPPPVPAPMGLGVPIVVLTLVALAWSIGRRFTKAGTQRALRIGAFGAAIGNALMDIAAILQPDRPSVVEIERVRGDARAPDDEGDGRSTSRRRAKWDERATEARR
jgi:hypothetical protein